MRCNQKIQNIGRQENLAWAEGRTQGMVIEVELVTENQRNQQSPAGQDGGLTTTSGMQTGLSRKGLTLGGESRETKENIVSGIPWRC